MKEQSIKIVKDEFSEVLVSKIEIAKAEMVIELGKVASLVCGQRFEIDTIIPEYHYAQNEKEYSCMIVMTLTYKETEKWILKHS